MYERASTWAKRRASAAEVAAARLLSLTMRSKSHAWNRRAELQARDAKPRTSLFECACSASGRRTTDDVGTWQMNSRAFVHARRDRSDSMGTERAMEPPVMPLLNLSHALGLQPQPPAQLSPRALISSPRSPRSTSASPRAGSQSPRAPWVSSK